jgi:hypothetical protein
LSGSKQRESNAIGKDGSSAGGDQSGSGPLDAAGDKAAQKSPETKASDTSRDKSVRKQRASDLGRALRSIYDDTLRESVPDDFSDLLGKLS